MRAREALERVQGALDFDGWEGPHFAEENGRGRHGIAGLVIGCGAGFHAAALLLGALAGRLSASMAQWCSYCLLLSCFHAIEWLVTALKRPEELGYKSWLLNHSKGYTVAILASAAEFWLEYLLLPPWLSPKGRYVALPLLVCAAALGVRAVGMVTCAENFDHIVMTGRKREGHQLVTRGVYGWLRHPAYFGWFYWAIGGQVLLGNPVCAAGFAFVSRSFFQQRIPAEEAALLDFYGSEYATYAAHTPIAIPFVSGAVPFRGMERSWRGAVEVREKSE